MANEITNIDNSSALANSLFTTLTTGITLPDAPDFTDDKYNITPDPTSELYKALSTVSIDDVTTDSLEGTGAFDIMMRAVENHIEREFKEGRIVGDEYGKVYLGGLTAVLQNATNFALNKEQTKWQAIVAQMQARIAEIQATQALIELEKTKFETTTALFQMNLAGAQYALTKMQIATEEANHDSVTADVAIKTFQRNYQMPADLAVTQYERTAVQPSTVAMNEVQYKRVLPAQAAIAEYQNRVLQPLEADIQKLQRDSVIPTGVDIEQYKLTKMMPVELGQMQHQLELRMPAETKLVNENIEVQRAQTLDTRADGLTPIGGVIGLQKRNLTVDADTKDYVLANQLPTQVTLISKQIDLTAEQRESERAKTLETRSDGATVEGSVGKQKDLYDQQIDSFIKDAQHKAAKMYLDAYITQKTLDEGLPVPAEFGQTSISNIMATVRANNNLN